MNIEYNIYLSLQEFQQNYEDDYYLEYLETDPELTFPEHLLQLTEVYSELRTENRVSSENCTKDFENKLLTDAQYKESMANYQNIFFAWSNILRFIKRKYEVLILRTQIDATTQDKTKTSLTVPQKIKILDQINLKGYLQGKGFTIFQIEKLVSDLLDRSDKTVRDNFNNPKNTAFAENYITELKNLKANR